ncbi:MAG: SpoIIE family protein phosphatase [Chlorobi bacterium]|nr:SpoIIE family protein phosphatase [Chlorobiota bacterium]
MNKPTLLIIIFGLLLNYSYSGYSQNNRIIDSLETTFEQTTDDSLKNEALTGLFNEYLKNDWGMAINTAKNGTAVFKETNPEKTVFWYNKLGNIYSEQGFYTLSLNAFSQALKINNQQNKNSAYIYLNIAKIYYYQEKYDKSIETYNNALNEFNNLKQTNNNKAVLGIAKTYNKMGIVYELKGNIEKSKQFFKKSLNLRLQINNKKDIIDSYTSLGYFSNVIQEYDSAFYYFSKGLKICNIFNDFHYFNDAHLFRSETFAKTKQFKKAYQDIDSAKQYAFTFDKFDIARVYYYYMKADFEKNDYNKLKSDGEIALQYADSFNNNSVKEKTLKLLTEAAIKYSDYENAYKFQLQLSNYLKLNETEKLIKLEQNIELETEKKQNTELTEVNKNLQKNITLFQLLIALGVFILIFIFLLLLINKRKNKKIKAALIKAEKEKKNADDAKNKLEESTELTRSQAVLAEILRNVTGKERSLENFLQDALNKLLNLPWLDVISKGSIFLTNEDGNLNMVAGKDLGEIAVRCAVIKPGECLCGKALSEKKMQFCNHIDHNHEIRIKNMTEHGHYNLPIIMHGEVLGVLNLYTEHNHKKTDSEIKFLQTVAETLASVIHRKKSQDEILKTKDNLEKQKIKLEEKNKAIRLFSAQIEQKKNEQEILNHTIITQKKAVELKQKETETYAKELEQKAKEQEALNQKLFAQKLEVEQRNTEVELYSKQLEEKAKEQEALNQKLFAQKLEAEQRNTEVELYSKQVEEKAKEQEALNQKLFAQKLEVEQRNSEVQQYLEQIEKQNKEQEALNQKLFAQSLEVDQRRFEIEMYSKEIEQLKDKAEEALDHLNASINYSKFILNSLLPDNDFINKIKNQTKSDFFIYFKPKETIGGDFYYMRQINDTLIIGVADCTGHGIPGALITMLGISFLDDIIIRNLVDTTGEGLNLLREKIKDIFKSKGDSLENKNGLDIALCAVNLKTNVMQYSGAFNSLYLFRKEEFTEYKATRNPIGYYPLEKDFETTEIQLQKGDVLYLFSDGYADQIGGEKNRKFSKRQFKHFLSEIHTFPISKQHIFAEKIMQKWMGKNQQVDDITLMGIKWENEI